MNYIDAIARDIQKHTGADDGSGDLELYRYYALLALTTGIDTTNENVHDAWAAWTSSRRPGHKSLVPFATLAPEVQALYQTYTDAIKAVVRGWFGL